MARILFYSEEPILAEGLSRILARGHDLEIVGHCTGIGEVPERLEVDRPDILLLHMNASVTHSWLTDCRRARPETRIVLWLDTVSSELALQAITLGVRGILRRSVAPDVLLRCLTRIAEGELWFEKSFTDSIMSMRRCELSPREGQLITLLSQGLRNKEIGDALSIAEGTVKVYFSRLYQKLGVKDRYELALYGLKNLTPEGGAFASHELEAGELSGGQRPQAPRTFFVRRIAPQSEMRPAAAARFRY